VYYGTVLLLDLIMWTKADCLSVNIHHITALKMAQEYPELARIHRIRATLDLGYPIGACTRKAGNVATAGVAATA